MGDALVKIRAAENSVIHMNIPPRRQQPYKGAAQRAAVGRPDMSAAMLLNVSFYFLCFLQYSGKLGMFRLIEAVVADAENAIAVRQQRNDPSKIALPVAAGAGEQQDDRRVLRTEGINFHLPTPFRNPLFAIFSVSSDSS